MAFSPDGTKIVSGSHDKTIKVWDSGVPEPSKSPSWPKLTPVGLSGRQTGAAEREDERPQQMDQLGGVFPGWDQDRVGIGRQDDQSLGFGCAGALKIALLAKTDTCWLVWQSNWSSSAKRQTPTATTSSRSRFPLTGPRLCPDRATRRSKYGIRVRCSPQNRPSLAKNDACWLVSQTNWRC